jgi:tRNA A-37 threonylcarbamoyl transferase component Bud32
MRIHIALFSIYLSGCSHDSNSAPGQPNLSADRFDNSLPNHNSLSPDSATPVQSDGAKLADLFPKKNKLDSIIDKFSKSVPSEAAAAQAESELASMTTEGSPELESLELQAERAVEADRKHAALNKLEGSSILEKFDIFEKECETWGEARKDSVDCESSISSVNVAGKGWIKVKRTPNAPKGLFAVVYPTVDPNLVIKISKNEGFCNEIAALQALDGLDGFTPKMYPLDRSNPGIRTHCLQRVIVMDAVGDKTFSEIPQPTVQDTYTRLGKLLEAIKTLHATGISHGDLHGNNIRVNSADPSKVFLVDFGLVEKGINEEDLSKLCFRASVPHRETDTIVKNFCIATGVGVIDSDFWIALFRRLGADPNGLDDATRSAVEKIRQESVATLL